MPNSDAVYQHVFDSYWEDGRSVYSVAAWFVTRPFWSLDGEASKRLWRALDTRFQNLDNTPVAIRHFLVEARAGLRKAEAQAIPNLMAIAGPNGSGKSNLLEGIRQQRDTLVEPASALLYVGPHRTWRSSQVHRVGVYGFEAEGYLDVLTREILPGFQWNVPGNLQMLQNQPRQASSADDAQAFIKTAIIRLLDKQRTLVTETWEAQGRELAKDAVPDLFSPLRLLVTTLLPHLGWDRVDDANESNIRCVFRPRDNPGLEFEIDDLSSGEKSAIALFLPFIERQAARLAAPDKFPSRPDVVPLTMLIDEPEIHLHPLLQLNVLEYMRTLARNNEAQFIFTTHSPTILDALTEDELWLLSPRALAQDNQLVQLANSHEHLEAARIITGSTHLLTRCKPIVFVEGEPDLGAAASDERLLRLLLPDTRHWAIVPSRDKRGVVQASGQLRGSELALPGQPIFGLVDADRDDETKLPDYIISWPVAMIENLMLDPKALLAVLDGFEAVTGLRTVEQVRSSLSEIASGRRDEEVALRIQAQLPVGRISLGRGELSEPDQAIERAVAKYRSKLDAAGISELREQAETEVDEITKGKQELERFHGKEMLYTFYAKHQVASAGLGKAAFATKLAVACAGSERVKSLAISALDRIRLFFPSGLGDQIGALSGLDEPAQTEADALAAACAQEYQLWVAGTPSDQGREGLRQRIFAFAQTLHEKPRAAIGLEASRIGTP